MKRGFHFRTRTSCQATECLVDALVVFFARQPADITVLTDEIQNCLKSDDPLPDVLYVIGTSSTIDSISGLWAANPSQISVLLERGNPPGLSAIREHALIEFRAGEFLHRPLATGPLIFEISISRLLRDGLAQLVKKNEVYQLAPSGHVFKHPSGRSSKQFFLASELLRNDVDVYFVALCVCAEAWACLQRAERIFIDTMGIYPVAKAIHELLLQSGREVAPSWEIDNFHSHDGLQDLEPGIADTDVALISASTSGGLANALFGEKSFRARNIITLLDINRGGRVGWIVHANSEFSDPSSPEAKIAMDVHETPIELVGEYFAARGKRPKALTLGIYHAPQDLKKILDIFSAEQNSSINRQRPSGQVDVVSLAPSVVLANEDFIKWVRDEVRLKTPASATHVMSDDDVESLSMSELVASTLEQIQGRRPVLVRYSAMEILREEGVGGVVICAPLVGNGHLLRLISRDLREACPSASRHFLLGLGTPDSYESWLRLNQFLSQSGVASRPYIVSSWMRIALGRKRPNDCWSKYALLMQGLEHVELAPPDGCSIENLATSLELASALLEEHASSLLPSTSGLPMKLTEGFVYWQPSKEKLCASNGAPISYLAITAALQHAREFKDENRRLRSTLYETVVLDPETFVRFNDGVLQSCLLRGAYTAELDYSMSVEASQSMREIVEKVYLNHQRRYGEAALEFAAALAAGHLRLTYADAAVLFERIRQLLLQKSALSGLIYVWWRRYGNSRDRIK